MKAIILTYAPVQESDKEILKNTKIFKIAINGHAEELKPHLRICSDYILGNICREFSQQVVSVRERFRSFSNRAIYPDIEFKGATILAAVDYLLQKRYDEILIVGDNTVNTKEFQDNVNDQLSPFVGPLVLSPKIYQYTKGNFELPVMSIKEFCSPVYYGELSTQLNKKVN